MSVEPSKLPEPWERQEGESEEAWLAFRAYRDMPPDERQVKRAAVARMHRLSQWYRDHNWSDRCKSYDAKFDAIRVEEREAMYRRASRQVAIDHMVLLADARELITREMSKLVSASRDTEVHGLIKPEALIKLCETTVKLDRLVRGETTENVGKTDVDLSKLSLDEIRTLHGLLAKAEKKEDEVPETSRLDS